MTTTVLPEQSVAAVVHEGSYATLGSTHAAIAAWSHEHGYEVTGPATETYFNSPAEVAEADLRTEVALPIRELAGTS